MPPETNLSKLPPGPGNKIWLGLLKKFGHPHFDSNVYHINAHHSQKRCKPHRHLLELISVQQFTMTTCFVLAPDEYAVTYA